MRLNRRLRRYVFPKESCEPFVHINTCRGTLPSARNRSPVFALKQRSTFAQKNLQILSTIWSFLLVIGGCALHFCL
uniref:Uncharacterized protein n=1 Tax=Hippocampus comes TaxID=109280 RepID=A0A3Q2XHC9_HIPCM